MIVVLDPVGFKEYEVMISWLCLVLISLDSARQSIGQVLKYKIREKDSSRVIMLRESASGVQRLDRQAESRRKIVLSGSCELSDRFREEVFLDVPVVSVLHLLLIVSVV